MQYVYGFFAFAAAILSLAATAAAALFFISFGALGCEAIQDRIKRRDSLSNASSYIVAAASSSAAICISVLGGFR